MRSTLFAALAALALACSLHAQACITNLVPNGDFQALLPTWPVTGNVTANYPTTVDVNAVVNSRCLELSRGTSYRVMAPGQLSLGTGPYEFSMDVLRYQGWGTTIDVGITRGGVRTSVGTTTMTNLSGYAWRRTRISLPFTPPAADSYALDFAISTHVDETIAIDNVTVHPSNVPVFNLTSHWRRAGTNQTWTLRAPQNDYVALAIALGQQTPPLAVPPCTGTLQIGPFPDLALHVQLTSVPTGGVLSDAFPVPAAVARIPLYWQAVGFDPTGACYLGCGDMIAFPR